MKLTKTKLKQLIKEEIKHILNEGYGSLSPEQVARLADGGWLSASIADDWLKRALSNYVLGFTSGYTGDKVGIDTSAYDVRGGKSTLDPKLASQYQAALGEGNIGRGERGQRRFLDRLVDKHWEKLLQIRISEMGVTQPPAGMDLTFGDVLDVLAYHGEDAEDFKEALRYRLEQTLNKPPGKVGAGREAASQLRTQRQQHMRRPR